MKTSAKFLFVLSATLFAACSEETAILESASPDVEHNTVFTKDFDGGPSGLIKVYDLDDNLGTIESLNVISDLKSENH